MKSVILVCVAAVLLCGCAAGHNQFEDTANQIGNVAGFWRGLWHGMVAPITFFISLFSDSVNVYEVHNNGGWYNFGFVLGIGGFASSCSVRSKSTETTTRYK